MLTSKGAAFFDNKYIDIECTISAILPVLDFDAFMPKFHFMVHLFEFFVLLKHDVAKRTTVAWARINGPLSILVLSL